MIKKDPNKGLIFNIQRYSVHDGPGIRTIVFLQGCPLRCPWCCNPESQSVRPVTWVKNGKKETISHWMTADEVMDEIEKDEIFYRTSGGGVTLSGGECLMQADFGANILRQCKQLGISTAIETTGAMPLTEIQKVLPYTDYVMFDLKIMNPIRAKQVIGDNVAQVKASFEEALATPTARVMPRVPLIPGYTTVPKNLQQIADYVHEVGVKEIHILPFHQYGSSKYEYLNRTYTMKDTPLLTDQQVSDIHSFFEDQNIHAVVNGLE
ncbi:[formate-C-acetyltransferase]-activating enzyme [Lactobacillus selangorensis]|uniref:[formate-C-acetyltransferase]-activating enzyme n=1 Tax=Lactobacillus selangorensis TaxID=81857 RepID=A0A0R2FZB6_9LACO|nr:glycyl-radical enzyme activating protein [Lactobacillus selangorensis]KRN27959.1 [formate-C-acetyltransferase]-activating enzyme [Lactobacillus selangorensis]KRN30570.1 [formate-C-acetyltransferase]-activating enzyme [Lactobacillus selangorensis]